MLRGEAELAEPWAKQMVLGLGLLFLGKQGAVEATVEVRSLQTFRLQFVPNTPATRCCITQHNPLSSLCLSFQIAFHDAR